MEGLIGYISAVYLTIIAITGATFNGLVIAVLARKINSISVPNIFILSTCVSGFLACCIPVPQAIWFSSSGQLEANSCKSHAFMIYFFGTVSMLNLGAVAIEKYLTIVKYAYAHGNFLTCKQAVIIVVTLWSFSLLLSVLPFAGWSSFGPEASNITCSLRWDKTAASDVSYFVVMFMFVFIAPVGVMAFSYYAIYKVRSKVNKVNSTFNAALNDDTRAAIKKEVSMAMKLLMMILAFLLAWTPYSLVVIMIIAGTSLNTSYLLLVASLFAKASFTYNPVLYAFISKRFRHMFLEMFWRGSVNRVVPINSS